jgi:hypothetical protein
MPLKLPSHTQRFVLLVVLCLIGAASYGQQGPSIEYHGDYLLSPAHVYIVWYGNWGSDTAQSILPDFINGLNGSNYLNVLTSYNGKVATGPNGQYANEYLTNQVTLGGQAWDWYSYGSSLDDTASEDVLQNHLYQFGTDPFGVYFLLISPDVSDSAGGQHFCTDYIGYHSHSWRNGINMVYAVVPSPANCPAGIPQSNSPNGNAAADGMALVMGHEFGEAVTNPNAGNGSGWFHLTSTPSSSQVPYEGEMGDLCESPDSNVFYGPFGSGGRFITGNGSVANVTLGSRNFLVQELFAATGGCTLSYVAPPPPPTGGGGGGGCGATQPVGLSGSSQSPAPSTNNGLTSTSKTSQSSPSGKRKNLPDPRSTQSGPVASVICSTL